MLLYYITDRTQFSGNAAAQRRALLGRIAEAANCGVDLIQLREKDLSSRDLEALTREALEIVRGASSSTRLLVNSRTDIAMACGADGVHLRSDDVSPAVVRALWGAGKPTIGVSCHSLEEIRRAAEADFAVFGPVFEKASRPVTGIDRLREACRVAPKIIALGGVTLQNAAKCLEAGAAGVAGIRLFQQGDLRSSVELLREVGASLRP